MLSLYDWSILVSIIGVSGLVIKFAKQFLSTKEDNRNLLLEDVRLPVKPLELNQKQRDALLKQAFKPAYANEDWDCITIGSGIGALSTAALLSRSGKKVLVLEQHDQAGGACHTFTDKGYEFDVGIHYIGEMNEPTVTKTLVEQISHGQIQWDPMDEEFDVIIIKACSEEQREYRVPSGKGKWQQVLKETFSEESKGIDDFFALIDKASSSMFQLIAVKLLPLWIVKLLSSLGIFERFFTFFQLNQRTTEQVVMSLTKNRDLQLLLMYTWGTHATPPSKTGFPVQVLTIKHYECGASYPRGGASEIAKNVIPVIEASGGRVCVRVNVKEILTESGKVVGVIVDKSGSTYRIPAKIVVSDAGVHNTMKRLLNPQIARKSRMWSLADELKPGIGCFSVFIGLDASDQDLGLKAQNVWAFLGDDPEEDFHRFNESTIAEVLDKDYPLLFIGFPSAKDSLWKKRHPGKSTITVVTFAPWEWFEKWSRQLPTKRGDEYDEFKNAMGHRIVQQVCRLFPNIEKHVDYVSVGTPVTNEHYLAAYKGGIYGLDHTARRYQSDMAAILRPRTDINGLFLTGQDVISSGFTAALYTGLLCAGEILNRDLYSDLLALHEKIQLKKKSV